MLEDTAIYIILILIALYFILKWAVKNGVKAAYKDIAEQKSKDALEKGSESEASASESEDEPGSQNGKEQSL